MRPSTGLARGVYSARPATRWQDASLTGNGRHGALVFGSPHAETVVLTHHDLVLPNGSARAKAPLVADRLAEVRQLILAGRGEAAIARFGEGEASRWGQSFHPAFALRLRSPARPYRRYRRATDFSTGVVSVSWSDDAGDWQRDTFVSRADDVVVQRLRPAAPDVEHDLHHDAALPGAPEGLRAVADANGVVVRYPALDPGGDGEVPGYVGATRAVRTGSQLLLLTRVARPRLDQLGAGVDLELLRAELAAGLRALSADPEELLARHLLQHRTAYRRVSLRLDTAGGERDRPAEELLAAERTPAVTAALLERMFDAGRYHLLSASGVRPPRLVGLWQGDWDAAWAAGFTLDANLGVQLAGAVAGDLPEAVEALADLVHDQLDDWRDNARRLFGARGVVSPAHTDGENGAGFHFSPRWPLTLWTAGADWLLAILLDHVAAGGDETFDSERVRPLLAEVAAFYRDFLSERDETGLVAIVPSYSPENAPLGGSPAAVNATMDVAAARHALGAFDADADADAAAAGRELLAALPPYRINDDGALAEWAWPGLADDYGHRHVSHLYPVWPLREITPHGTPELAAAAVRALRLRGEEDDSAHGYLHRGLVAARLHQRDLLDGVLERLLAGDFCFDNLMSSHYPGRDVFNADASCGLPGLLLEALVNAEPGRNGQPGRLELLPALPSAMPAGTLTGVRTVAGVRVARLRWDLPGERVTVVLESDLARPVDVVHAGVTWPVRLNPGVPCHLSWSGPFPSRTGPL